MPVRKYGRCSKLKPSTEHDTGKNPEGDIISHRFETLEYLRRRPLGSVQSNAVEPASEEPKIGEALAAANGTVRSWDFEFDHVFRPAASQGEVFEEVALLVQSALDGYRVAILAYGPGPQKPCCTAAPPAAPGWSLRMHILLEMGIFALTHLRPSVCVPILVYRRGTKEADAIMYKVA
eukprot:s3992_g4.t1